MSLYIILIAVLLLTLTAIPAILLNRESKSIDDQERKNSGGKYIKLSDGFTHYEITGDDLAPVILLIHGFSVPFYMWDKNTGPMAEAGFRVIRYDMYGRGLSDRPGVKYDADLFIRQIDELLTGLAVNGRITVIGTSMGGAVAAAYIERYPQRVEKLVLIDPVHETFKAGILKTPLLGKFIAYTFLLPGYPSRQLNDFHQPENFRDWPHMYMMQVRYKGFRYAVFSTILNFLTNDPERYYASVRENKIPSLVIWGKEDRVIPLHGIAALKELIDPQIFIVFHAGHLPHYERPEIVNPVIINFLLKEKFVEERAYI